MKRSLFVLGLVFLSGLVLFSACKKDKQPEENTGTNNFDRKAMLVNYADSYILPAYEDMVLKLADLKTQIEQFTAAPDDTKLTNLQNSWRTAYLTWQGVDMLEFGPAEDISLRMYINTYPATVSKITSNINTSNYNLDQFEHKDAQGFPALDYLLNGIGSRQDVLSAYTSDAQATARKKYLNDVVNKMLSKVKGVKDSWTTYRTTFTESTGTDAGSSLSKMVNSYVLYYERYLRSGKVGLPAGAMTGVGAPQLTEAYYTPELSKELALAALKNYKKFYEGRGYITNADGQGMKDYLTAIGTKDDDGRLMADVIAKEIDEATTALGALNSTIKESTTNNRTALLTAYQQLQEVVPVIKVDMVSAFGISITYTDNDGD